MGTGHRKDRTELSGFKIPNSDRTVRVRSASVLEARESISSMRAKRAKLAKLAKKLLVCALSARKYCYNAREARESIGRMRAKLTKELLVCAQSARKC